MRRPRPTRPRRPGAARPTAALALLLTALTLTAACADDPAPVASAGAADAAGDGGVSYPWASQPDGAPRIADVAPEASLEFPPGTAYGEALTALLVAARRGGLPAEAVVRDPLPPEVVYAEPRAGHGLRLSLTAPWGWVSGTGAIRAPSIAIPGHLAPEEAMAIARAASQPGADPLAHGATVDVPRLDPCQVEDAGGERPPCR